jgi:hypothetical protein
VQGFSLQLPFVNDITVAGAETCKCGGRTVLRVEREREEKGIEQAIVIACWNGHRSYLSE